MELPKEIVLITYNNGSNELIRYKQFSNGSLPPWARDIRIEVPDSFEKTILDKMNADIGIVINPTENVPTSSKPIIEKGLFSIEATDEYAPNGDPGWVVTCEVRDNNVYVSTTIITPAMTKDMALILVSKMNSDLSEFIIRSENLKSTVNEQGG